MTIRSRVTFAWWRFVNSAPIAQLPWSAIRRVGQSRLLSLTIVVPFLGSFLLFNQHIVELLTLSPDLVRRWTNFSSTSSADDAARQLTLSRLYYVYFGLTFLGVGSALFTLFCPLIVKNYASAIECLQAERSLVTRSRIALIVSDVASSYVDWLGVDDVSPSLFKRMGQPTDFINLCSVAILEVFSDLPSALFSDESDTTETVQSPDVAPSSNAEVSSESDSDPFYDHRGRPDPYCIATTLTSGFRQYQWFVQAFREQAGSDSNRNDMLNLHYTALDHTRPALRMLVAAFYGVGFFLLAIPTVITFLQLTRHVFR